MVRVWRMRCEHAAKVSRLAKFLFTGKVTMVSRFVNRTTFHIKVVFFASILTSSFVLRWLHSLFMKNYRKTSQRGMYCYWILSLAQVRFYSWLIIIFCFLSFSSIVWFTYRLWAELGWYLCTRWKILGLSSWSWVIPCVLT